MTYADLEARLRLHLSLFGYDLQITDRRGLDVIRVSIFPTDSDPKSLPHALSLLLDDLDDMNLMDAINAVEAFEKNGLNH